MSRAVRADRRAGRRDGRRAERPRDRGRGCGSADGRDARARGSRRARTSSGSSPGVRRRRSSTSRSTTAGSWSTACPTDRAARPGHAVVAVPERRHDAGRAPDAAARLGGRATTRVVIEDDCDSRAALRGPPAAVAPGPRRRRAASSTSGRSARCSTRGSGPATRSCPRRALEAVRRAPRGGVPRDRARSSSGRWRCSSPRATSSGTWPGSGRTSPSARRRCSPRSRAELGTVCQRPARRRGRPPRRPHRGHAASPRPALATRARAARRGGRAALVLAPPPGRRPGRSCSTTGGARRPRSGPASGCSPGPRRRSASRHRLSLASRGPSVTARAGRCPTSAGSPVSAGSAGRTRSTTSRRRRSDARTAGAARRGPGGRTSAAAPTPSPWATNRIAPSSIVAVDELDDVALVVDPRLAPGPGDAGSSRLRLVPCVPVDVDVQRSIRAAPPRTASMSFVPATIPSGVAAPPVPDEEVEHPVVRVVRARVLVAARQLEVR